MSRVVRVGVVQMCSTPDLEQNVAFVCSQIAAAASEGAPVVVFPENCTHFAPESERLARAQPVDGPAVGAVADCARAHGVSVILGSVAERGPAPSHTYNTTVCIDSTGAVVATYRKIHLFDVSVSPEATYRESASVVAGDASPVVVDLGGIRWGLSICYDLRFPELYRALVSGGAEALLVPAAFTRPTGAAHWEVLARARAIENLSWVLAPAQTGEHFVGRSTYGHSLAVSPWGEVVLDAGESVGLRVVEVDLGLVVQSRARIPCLAHRRL